MTEKVKLVQLEIDQITLAKMANGERKQITHAVVCGEYGQIFGTEKQCRKYFSTWSQIFPHLFKGGEETSVYEFKTFETTPVLVTILIDAHDTLDISMSKDQISNMPNRQKADHNEKKGFFARLLRL